jgi:hypothetical protein
MPEKVLSDSEIEHFIRRGFVRISRCFSRELARDWTTRACQRLHCSLEDPSTWPKGLVRAPKAGRWSFESIAPKGWKAACELVGGESRARAPCLWDENFVVNFGGESVPEWQPPSSTIHSWQRWHKDAHLFRQFLDSPEHGLLVFGVFSDIEERGGATYIACDSVGHVARFFAAHPEGVLPRDVPANDIVARCRDFVETTAETGDMFLLHPFMLHTSSINASTRARFMINKVVKLREPMVFAREDRRDYSPVEMAVLRGLGVSRYEFVPTHPREAIAAERTVEPK